MARLVRAALKLNTIIQPENDFCCFRSVIHIALTEFYKLKSFLNIIRL